MADLITFPDPDWQRDFICYPNTTTPQRILGNVFLALTKAQEWKGVVWYDDFKHKIMLGARVPGSGRAYHTPRGWTDIETHETVKWLGEVGLHVGKNLVEDAVALVASHYHRHPLVEYLCGLTWDETPRLDFWLKDHFGVEDSELSRAFGKNWMISAVARVFEPGCQADHCLILEGPQGVQKTTALRMLAGEPYYAEHKAAMISKDAALECTGGWIQEISELSSMRRGDKEVVKAFITRRVDRFRPPYARHIIDVPRTCVFAGTTNESHYLVDTTGNRRFWPVQCGFIDVDGIADARDNLWAEAVTLYNQGAPWWLSKRMEALAAAQQEERVVVDDWLEPMKTYIKGRKTVSTGEFLHDHLKLEWNQISVRESIRAANCLKMLGWTLYKTEKKNLWVPPVIRTSHKPRLVLP